MKILSAFILAILLHCTSTANALDQSIDSIAIPRGSNIYTDNLRNLYVVSPTNDIIKYDYNGNKLAVANFKVLGNISHIDVSNPFEIYVFYRDQNKIVFLDNLLNNRGEFDLEDIGVSQIACIGRSFDNQIWLFDLADLKIKKYSKDQKLLLESAPFNTFLSGDISPTQILDNNNNLYLLNNNKILEFDIFANYNTVKFSDTLQSFQNINGRFVYYRDHKLYVYQPKTFTLKTIDYVFPENCRNARIEKGTLYILTDEFVILSAYSIE